MSFETVKDVLDHVREFHGKLSALYKRLGEKRQKERVRIILDFLSSHEKHLENSLGEYETEVSKRILNTWLQFPPPPELLNRCQSLTIDEDREFSVDDVVDLALEVDRCLIDLYGNMAESAEIDNIKELFENLLNTAKQRSMDLVRDAQEFQEI